MNVMNVMNVTDDRVWMSWMDTGVRYDDDTGRNLGDVYDIWPVLS